MVELSISYKSKVYKISLPEGWNECSIHEVDVLMSTFLFSSNGITIAIDKYLRKQHKLPKRVIRSFIRVDLIAEALSFVTLEPLYSQEITPKRMGLINGPGLHLSYMIMKDYALCGVLMNRIDLEAEPKILRKALRHLCSITYKSRYVLLTSDRIWHWFTCFYRTKTMLKAYLSLSGALRFIAEQYPNCHISDGVGSAPTLRNSESFLNSLSGGKFGSRKETELYRIRKILPEMEELAIKRAELNLKDNV
ncbi:MAG: hypothetical protein ACRBFS_20960 [Aureispira sp.]